MKELKVIQSTTEPKQTSVLWLSPEGLKRFTSKGWEVISGSSSGSGSGGNGGGNESSFELVLTLEEITYGEKVMLSIEQTVDVYKYVLLSELLNLPPDIPDSQIPFTVKDIINMSKEELETILGHEFKEESLGYTIAMIGLLYHSNSTLRPLPFKFIVKSFIKNNKKEQTTVEFDSVWVGDSNYANIIGLLAKGGGLGNISFAMENVMFPKPMLSYRTSLISKEYTNENLPDKHIQAYNDCLYNWLDSNYYEKTSVNNLLIRVRDEKLIFKDLDSGQLYRLVDYLTLEPIDSI